MQHESPPPEAPLVSAQKIADELSVSARYVHMMAAQGAIPCVRFGVGSARKCVRFDREQVMAAIGRETRAQDAGINEGRGQR